MTTLQDVVDQLKINNDGIAKTATNIESFVKSIERNRLDDLENRKEAQRKIKAPVPAAAAGGMAAGKSDFSMPNIGLLLNPKALIAPLLAGAAAILAWTEGMRGWELPLLQRLATTELNLRAMFPTSISNAITQKYVNMRARILGWFGLSADLKKLPGSGAIDPELKTPITTQIATHLKNMKANMLLKYFGIGLDGKPTVKITGGGKVWLATEDAIGFLLKPLKAISAGAVALKASPLGLWIAEKFGKLGGKATGVLKLFTRILRPIAVLMSLFKGVTAFMETEGTFYEKFKEGLATSLADFIGAPLNLLKSLIAWGLKKMGFKKQAEWINQNIDFEKAIHDLILGLFKVVEDVVAWAELLVTDPVEALDKLLLGILGGAGSLLDFMWNSAVAPLMTWIAEKFGVKLELPEANLAETLTATYERIKTSLKQSIEDVRIGIMATVEEMAIMFKTMPSKIKLDLEELWVRAVANLKTGFINFTEWVSEIPDRIIISSLGLAVEKLPFWLSNKLGIVDAHNAALANISKDVGSTAQIRAIDKELQQDLFGIEARRERLSEYEQTLIDQSKYLSQTTNVVNNTALIEPDINPADRFDPHSPIGGVVLR